MARCAGTLPIGQVITAKIRLHDVRHNSTPGRLLSEIGAKATFSDRARQASHQTP